MGQFNTKCYNCCHGNPFSIDPIATTEILGNLRMPALQRWHSHLGGDSVVVIFNVAFLGITTDSIQKPFDIACAIADPVPKA
jgi:hypothetical protein